MERSYYFKDGKHYVVGGIIPPVLFNFVDKLAICPWWVNVPLGTTFDDIVWIKDDGTQTNPKPNNIEVKSSDGSSKYIIKKVGDKYHCSCPGYYRAKDRICKHIKQLK
jgi:hypothetical protein